MPLSLNFKIAHPDSIKCNVNQSIFKQCRTHATFQITIIKHQQHIGFFQKIFQTLIQNHVKDDPHESPFEGTSKGVRA